MKLGRLASAQSGLTKGRSSSEEVSAQRGTLISKGDLLSFPKRLSKSVNFSLLTLVVDLPLHKTHLRDAFERCRQYQLQLAPKKCYIGYRGLEYLGFRISGQGIAPSPTKIDAILHSPEPTTVKGIRSFLGLAI